MATQTYAGLTNEQRTFYIGTLIKRLIPYLPLLNDAQKRTIPQHMGTVAQWRKYGILSLATSALTEGTTPAGNSLAVTTVTGTVAQYGDFIAVSDLLQVAGIDDNVVESTEVLGEQAGQTIHRLMITTLGSGSTVRYASTAVSRVTVAAGMNCVVREVRLAVRDLEKANVPKFKDGTYHGAVSPSQKFDLIGDPAFQDLYRYINSQVLQQNEIGTVYGGRFFETTDIPIFAAGGAGGIDVHAAVLYGPDAYGALDLARMAVGSINAETNKGVQVFVTGLDVPSKSDVLHQRAYVGWKVAFAAKVIDA